ncbi:hypothetical protein SAMN05444349_12564 [Bacteroides faecichinchillae]|uniref:Uncharacterized protein n=1 Tax=Bacteroides faecichinchillae TaxID=871325 RepID=A0A1M5CS18_9BACE|nr:hypothetical protein SAMN05444349_12564 [Bacteroides faecichinchillae]
MKDELRYPMMLIISAKKKLVCKLVSFSFLRINKEKTFILLLLIKKYSLSLHRF